MDIVAPGVAYLTIKQEMAVSQGVKEGIVITQVSIAVIVAVLAPIVSIPWYHIWFLGNAALLAIWLFVWAGYCLFSD